MTIYCIIWTRVCDAVQLISKVDIQKVHNSLMEKAAFSYCIILTHKILGWTDTKWMPYASVQS